MSHKPGLIMGKTGPRRNAAHIAVDMLVGKRIEMRRIMLGISQEQLGEAIGMSFQQVQKYESGKNRVSASRLFDLGKALGVSVSYFFQEIGEEQDELTTSDLKFAGYVSRLGAGERQAIWKLIEAMNAVPVCPYHEPVPENAIRLSRSGHVTHINGKRIV